MRATEVETIISCVFARAAGRGEEPAGHWSNYQLPQGALGSSGRQRAPVPHLLRPHGRRCRGHGESPAEPRPVSSDVKIHKFACPYRSRCQAEPPAPSWGTFCLTQRTPWLWSQFTQRERAYASLTPGRHVSPALSSQRLRDRLEMSWQSEDVAEISKTPPSFRKTNFPQDSYHLF